jgi:predicted TIM-barrel fold metal-dependent hydrolase
MPERPRVFDAHIHIQPHEELLPRVRSVLMAGRADFDRIESCLTSASKLLALMDEEGVERAVLINYVAPRVMGLTERVNPWIAKYVEGHRDRLIPVGGLDPTRKDAADEVKRLLYVHRVGAIKIHPPHMELAANAYRADCPGLAAVYRMAGEAGIPVLIHTGTSVFPGARNLFADPMPCDDVAIDFPETTIVLCHAGRPLWYDTAFFLARRHPNVRLDLSGIPPAKLLEVLPRIAEIADRVLWGTDWPSMGVLSMRRNVDAFLALPLAPEVQRKILFENASTLFE